MNKSDLENGAVVETRNGSRFIKIDNTLVRFHYIDEQIYHSWLDLRKYNDDLTYNYIQFGGEWDIMKVNNNVENECVEGACTNALKSLHKDVWTWIRGKNLKHILTPKEYQYLKAVIAPVRNKVQFIYKDYLFRSPLISNDESNLGYEFICIDLNGSYIPGGKMTLYLFEENTQFKEMELHKKYSLEELGLWKK